MTETPLRSMIKRHEGTKKNKAGRHILYKCSADKLTYGYGRNAQDKGFSQDEVELMLSNDIQEAAEGAMAIFPHFYTFSVNRQNALIDLVFNMGKGRIREFKKMIVAIEAGDWEEAAVQAEDSDWHKQVGARAAEVEKMLREG